MVAVQYQDMKVKTKVSGRVYIALSFSVPPELEAPMNQRAAELGMSRSQYLCRLVQTDLHAANLLDPLKLKPAAPPRIKRVITP